MSADKKNKNSAKKTTASKSVSTNQVTYAVVSEKVRNYENHPFFVKKAKAAKAFLDRVGLPEGFVTKAR